MLARGRRAGKVQTRSSDSNCGGGCELGQVSLVESDRRKDVERGRGVGSEAMG